ncbi:hypothetical protein HWV62_9853 [Athelia sp. TMB]|nr:hypothetical protein HWV62_9853 [Athelia sp. TMB]
MPDEAARKSFCGERINSINSINRSINIFVDAVDAVRGRINASINKNVDARVDAPCTASTFASTVTIWAHNSSSSLFMPASTLRKAKQALSSKHYRANNKEKIAAKALEARETEKVLRNYNKRISEACANDTLPKSSPPTSSASSGSSARSLPVATPMRNPRLSPETSLDTDHRSTAQTSFDEAGFTILREVRLGVQAWTKDLGPVEVWGRKFREGYDTALRDESTGRNTQDAVDAFLDTVEDHVEVGRKLLARLLSSSIVQPPKSHDAWADFLVVSDIMTVLHRGIAVLEARLDIWAPEGAQESELLSTNRRHQGFEAMM